MPKVYNWGARKVPRTFTDGGRKSEVENRGGILWACLDCVSTLSLSLTSADEGTGGAGPLEPAPIPEEAGLVLLGWDTSLEPPSPPLLLALSENRRLGWGKKPGTRMWDVFQILIPFFPFHIVFSTGDFTFSLSENYSVNSIFTSFHQGRWTDSLLQ